jgi:filamentous hemagglutinin
MSQALRAGDILRKGTASNSPASPSAAASATVSGTTTAPGILAQQDLLRRTSSALAAVQAMQTAAHAAAAASAATNLGSYINPANPAQTVPLLNVPDGMAYGDGKTTTGGLVPDSGLAANGVANPVTTWVGANTPTQTATTTAAGPSQITVAVAQTAATAVLNWQTFNIGKNTTLAINQSAGGSNVGQWVAFNQVGVTGAPLPNPRFDPGSGAGLRRQPQWHHFRRLVPGQYPGPGGVIATDQRQSDQPGIT